MTPIANNNRQSATEEGRRSGWSNDPTPRQVPPPGINAASLSKQKSPVGPDLSTLRDAVLDDGLEFSFTDTRHFARVRLFDDPQTVLTVSELGPDALFEPMSVDKFVDSLGGKKIVIKALLLDQSRIHPLQIASSLSRESCGALHRSIQEVVKYAVEVDADCDRFPEPW